MKNSEKRFIPGTNPEWGRELPDDYDNSLVDKDGKNWDNGYNFDERSDNEPERISPEEETTFSNLSEKVKFDPNSAQKAKEEAQKTEDEAKKA